MGRNATESPEQSRRRTFACVAGHEIRDDEIEVVTHVEALDGGALVRVCNEHGAPIAESLAPAER